jgi:hypothetical protein
MLGYVSQHFYKITASPRQLCRCDCHPATALIGLADSACNETHFVALISLQATKPGEHRHGPPADRQGRHDQHREVTPVSCRSGNETCNETYCNETCRACNET